MSEVGSCSSQSAKLRSLGFTLEEREEGGGLEQEMTRQIKITVKQAGGCVKQMVGGPGAVGEGQRGSTVVWGGVEKDSGIQ